MNKRPIVIVSLFIVLTIILFITFKLSQPTIAEQKENLANSRISIIDGDRKMNISLEELESIGSEEFEAILDTSSSNSSTHIYTGVQLKSIFDFNSINISDKKIIILTGADGYSVAYSVEEVLQDKNVFIAYMEDEEYISYQSIITSDLFSNRRCKWLTTIEVK